LRAVPAGNEEAVSGFGLVAIAFVLALLVTTIVFGVGILAIPVAAIAIAGIALFDFRRRRKQVEDVREFRDQAKAEKVDFTERDKETLASE
jgi:hypothetical protein